MLRALAPSSMTERTSASAAPTESSPPYCVVLCCSVVCVVCCVCYILLKWSGKCEWNGRKERRKKKRKKEGWIKLNEDKEKWKIGRKDEKYDNVVGWENESNETVKRRWDHNMKGG